MGEIVVMQASGHRLGKMRELHNRLERLALVGELWRTEANDLRSG